MNGLIIGITIAVDGAIASGGTPPVGGFILAENGAFLVAENGIDKLVIES